MEKTGALGMRHLTNILYRKDELSERTELVFRWVKEYDFTQKQFDELITNCNEKIIKTDKARRYGS